MSVYTELSESDIITILDGYELGQLQSYAGIAAGIENSNFFVNTDQGCFVLTVFERMSAEELPYFMHLMHHLSNHGYTCPDVMLRNDGDYLFDVAGKKGAVVSCLPGKTLEALSMAQLHQAGKALAGLHLAGADFAQRRDNATGFTWVREQAARMAGDVADRYGVEAAELLVNEVAWQSDLSDSGLPRGVIHGDLFCDNILFDGDKVSGVIDFYYAHDAAYAMDVAISLNALAVEIGEDDAARMEGFLAGYAKIRPLEDVEKALLPALLRRAALRFWTSRLYDALYPREGAMTTIKDPEEYRKKLLLHCGATQPEKCQ